MGIAQQFVIDISTVVMGSRLIIFIFVYIFVFILSRLFCLFFLKKSYTETGDTKLSDIKNVLLYSLCVIVWSCEKGTL